MAGPWRPALRERGALSSAGSDVPRDRHLTRLPSLHGPPGHNNTAPRPAGAQQHRSPSYIIRCLQGLPGRAHTADRSDRQTLPSPKKTGAVFQLNEP